MGIVVVGSVAYDTVKTREAQAKDVLGGSAIYFAVAASLFTSVKLVGVVGEDFRPQDREMLKRRGIDLAGLETVPGGKTFHWTGQYGAHFNQRTTLELSLNVFADFHPELPERYRKEPVLFLANIDPQLQEGVLNQMHSPRLVAADTMEHWIRDKKEALEKILPRLDILFVNDGEALELSGQGQLIQAARELLEMGPKRVVIKKGEHGALMATAEGFVGTIGYPLETVCDPTGAGDTFAGGFLGALAEIERPGEADYRRALACASAVASFTCEAFSLQKLLDLSRETVKRRCSELAQMTRMEG